MPKEEIILIKLGGSVITDKNQEKKADLKRIEQLAKEIYLAQKKTKCKLILGHGAGSFAHKSAVKYQTQNGIKNKSGILGASIVRNDAVELNFIVSTILSQEKIPAFSVSASSLMTSNNKKLDKLFFESILNLMNSNLTPVLYGDVITDKKIGCTIFSTEKILNILALKLQKRGYKVKFIIEVGKTEGVYDDNRKTIPEISAKNYSEINKYLAKSESADVTGGMIHKVEEAYELAKKNIPTLIISGSEGNLKNAILEKKVSGTWIR